MKPISLTASMRSNLLSLQNISGQVSLTQNHLSTGLKVNSAIDNPSAYYSARSLTNRASDLSALLDSMGQAVQTVKAATKGIEKGIDFLEQAIAVVAQALERTSSVNAEGSGGTDNKDDTGETEGSGGTGDTSGSGQGSYIVITQELIDQNGLESLITEGSTLVLNEDIKLSQPLRLGTDEYGNAKFNNISLDGNGHKITVTSRQGIDFNGNSELNDGVMVGVFIGAKQKAEVSDITITCTAVTFEYAEVYGIVTDGDVTFSSAHITATGMGNIIGSGIYSIDGTIDFIESDIGSNLGSAITGQEVNIISSAITNRPRSDSEQLFDGEAQIYQAAVNAYEFYIEDSTIDYGDRTNDVENQIAGVIGQSGSIIKSDVGTVIDTGYINEIIVDNSVATVVPFSYTGLFSVLSLDADVATEAEEPEQPPQATINIDKNYQQSFQNILQQYDSLIADSSYRGINLLQNDSLDVAFSEASVSHLKISGTDASIATLGVATTEWNNYEDLTKAAEEIRSALTSLRSLSSKFGNYYSIVTTRQAFTENLINVLTEGADKLTLADMNEESANMLALQTRQQLAINSLSLASQAAQGVLRLF